MTNDQYIKIFIDESKETLQKLNEDLLRLEANKEDLSVIHEIFRAAHTLKGMSQTMGFMNIGNLTHNMENMLDSLRSGKLVICGDLSDILFKSLDRLESLVEKIEESGKDDISTEDLVEKISSLMSGECTTAQGKSPKEIEFNEYENTLIEKAKEQSFDVKKIRIKFGADCVLPAVRAFMAVKALEGFGEIIKSVPTTEEIEEGKIEKDLFLVLVTQSEEEEISQAILDISEIEKAEVSDFVIRKDPSEITLDNSQPEAGKKTTKVASHTLRINADRIDKLMNLVGELVTGKSQLLQVANEAEIQKLNSVCNSIAGITGELQEIVINLRMLPVGNVFNRFPRLVRDISKELGKEVSLEMQGENTEIDRSVIDEISDPLVHIIKNSLDHGIELPEERIANNKPAKGRLILSANNEGDSIKITVTDDGKGIDPEKIKKIAIKKGLITEEESKKLTDKEAIELLFRAGFSTADVATDLSGRGVGLDVVKSKISELGGNVTLDSKIGAGTTIIITLPSTLAITQALLVKVSTETYAIPLNYISESVELPVSQIKTIQNKEVIVLRKETIPIIRLSKVLGLSEEKREKTGVLNILIANIHSNLIGLVVSEVINQYEIVMKPIDDFIGIDKIISSATILGDGRVALILNVNTLYEELKVNKGIIGELINA